METCEELRRQIASLKEQVAAAQKALDVGFEDKFVTPVLPTFVQGGDSWAHNLMAASENLRLVKLMQARAESLSTELERATGALKKIADHADDEYARAVWMSLQQHKEGK